MAIPTFVDQVTLHVYAGNGGHGCASIHREKFKPLGGPDGGNGGDGGSVVLRVDHRSTTLVDYYRQAHRRATNGEPGRGNNANGARGVDVLLPIPSGTVVTDADTGELIADLTAEGAEIVVAQGGRGGLGNAALASPTRKAPGFALLGEQGETRTITHEQRSEHWVVISGVADVVRGDETLVLTETMSVDVPAGCPHRLGNPGPELLHLVEVQTGTYLGEDDIVRLADDYGRHDSR